MGLPELCRLPVPSWVLGLTKRLDTTPNPGQALPGVEQEEVGQTDVTTRPRVSPRVRMGPRNPAPSPSVRELSPRNVLQTCTPSGRTAGGSRLPSFRSLAAPTHSQALNTVLRHHLACATLGCTLSGLGLWPCISGGCGCARLTPGSPQEPQPRPGRPSPVCAQGPWLRRRQTCPPQLTAWPVTSQRVVGSPQVARGGRGCILRRGDL